MELKARFLKTLYSSRATGYTVALYKAVSPALFPDGTSAQYIKAAGRNLPKRKGAEYTFSGKWQEDKAAGAKFIFAADDFSEAAPEGPEETVRYLQGLDGIGAKLALRIYAGFGEDVFRILDSEPERLLTVKGMRAKTLAKMRTSWIKSRKGKDLFTYLYGFQIPERAIREVFDAYEEYAMQIVRSEPYSLTGFSGIGFSSADRIARAQGGGLLCRQRIAAAMEQALRAAESAGSTCCTWQDLYEGSLRLLREDLSGKERKLLSQQMQSAAEKAPLEVLFFRLAQRGAEKASSAIAAEEADGELFFFRKNTLQRERALAKSLKRLSAAPSPVKMTRAMLESILEDGIREGVLTARLSPQQKETVFAALLNSLCIITGGPGTGKTFVLKAILYAWERLRKSAKPLLLAPTGRAAKRMEESSGYPAKTIHSALGIYETEGESRLTALPDCDLLIVDETSMLDNSLAELLFSSAGQGTKVILAGDERQLPSVGAGAVLREVLGSGALPSVRLTQVFRQEKGSSIAYNAARMQRGKQKMLEDESFSFCQAEGSEAIAEEAAKLYAELLKEYPLSEIAVLTPYRRSTATGAEALNRRLQKAAGTAGDGAGEPAAGDKVMFTKNMSGLANGDIGIITSARKHGPKKITCVIFGEEEYILDEQEAEHLELAYACTVHKSQGSEYRVVLLIMDPAHANMHTRQIVYTALTRAKERCIVIGSRKAFSRAVQNETQAERKSLLSYFLRKSEESAIEGRLQEEQLSLNI